MAARFLSTVRQLHQWGSSSWAYPPDFAPKHVAFSIEPAIGKFLNVDITGGLIRERSPEAQNYGVYFICNNRLIVKESKYAK